MAERKTRKGPHAPLAIADPAPGDWPTLDPAACQPTELERLRAGMSGVWTEVVDVGDGRACRLHAYLVGHDQMWVDYNRKALGELIGMLKRDYDELGRLH